MPGNSPERISSAKRSIMLLPIAALLWRKRSDAAMRTSARST
jgi:hypothetical protein